jgi:hypothetical protein
VNTVQLSDEELQRRRKSVRRSTIILSCVALAFYAAFIVMSVMRA